MRSYLTVLLVLVGSISVLSQAELYEYFHNLDSMLEVEYQKVLKQNQIDSVLNDEDIENIESFVDYYKHQELLLQIIIEDGISNNLNDFNPVFFSIYHLEWPSTAWAYCIYKHKELDLYKDAMFDIEDYYGNGLNNRVVHSKYFKEFPTNFTWDTDIEIYWDGQIINFMGLNLLFGEKEIEKVKIMLGTEDLKEVKEVATPY